MKSIRSSLIVIGLLVLYFQTVNAQVVLTHLGNHPFYQPSLTNSTELISMVNNNKNDIREGFDLVGLSELFDDFLLKLPDSNIKMINVQDGSHFEWMFARKNGEGPVRIAKDVTWINKTPFSAFQFYIDQGDKRYNFTVPLICGNIALSGISYAPSDFILPLEEAIDNSSQELMEETPESFSEPAVAVILPIEETLDMHSEPEVVILPVEETLDIPSVPSVSSTDQPEVIITTPAKLKGATDGSGSINFLTDIGYFHQFDPGHFFLGRIGIEYNISDNLSLLGLAGIAYHLSGTDGKTAYLADVLGEYKFDNSFVDIGVGGWFTNGDDDIPMENTQFDVIAAIGTKIFGESDGFNISLFIETRQGLKELDTIHEIRAFGRYGGGLRFRF